jgi:hypothetical protein
MRDMKPPCSAKPNWMPRKPNDMFQICQNESAGLEAVPVACMRVLDVVVRVRGVCCSRSAES